ncbi:hypothetical protein B0I33_102222 [Prauserella shujinwangii]|uniref:Uncharacterized protein n=1 Tax=Prauserella shujinwangii TaxID=1453103 RepID=A0A2T0M0I3_9PSEU|nr:hypothetical protein B0I33_102222 [Prauserella shujinwangii]
MLFGLVQPEKVMANAFGTGIHRMAYRSVPRPVRPRERALRWRHVHPG